MKYTPLAKKNILYPLLLGATRKLAWFVPTDMLTLYVCVLYLKYKKYYKSTAPSTKKQWQELDRNWEVQRMFIFASFGAGTFFCVMTSITDVEEENVMGQNAV